MIWYLAHPVASDDKYSFQQNMDHIVKLHRILTDCNIMCVAPYHLMCLSCADAEGKYRNMGLTIDVQIVSMLKAIILTGHRLSSGMETELTAVMVQDKDFYIYNLIGIPDEKIKEVMGDPAAILKRLSSTRVFPT